MRRNLSHAQGDESLHYVYILQCSDNTLYTGYTPNIEARVAAHNQGLGAKYTRGRTPVQLIYAEVYSTKSEALKREYQIKQLTRLEKLKLVQSYNAPQDNEQQT